MYRATSAGKKDATVEGSAGFNYADFDSAMSKFDTTFQVGIWQGVHWRMVLVCEVAEVC